MSSIWPVARGRKGAHSARRSARSLTVEQAWKEYAETRQTPPDERDRAIWRRFIEPTLGARLVANLTTAELERWLAVQLSTFGVRRPRDPLVHTDRERRRQSQYTANRRFNLLRAILNSAYRKDPHRIPSAEAWRRVRTYQRVEQPRTRVLEEPQCQRLLAVLPLTLRVLARAALHTGCRLSELEALRV